MNESTEIQIVDKIEKAKRGSLYFPESFLSLGNTKTINKALERLTKDGELLRVAFSLSL